MNDIRSEPMSPPMHPQRTELLDWRPVTTAAELVGRPVQSSLATWRHGAAVDVAEIDSSLSDTAEFCSAYRISPEESANCVVVTGKREGQPRYAACVVLATTRADVNSVVRRLLDVRKASFAPVDEAVALTGMEYGGITPIGVPGDWRILISGEVAAAGPVVIGSGLRRSKLRVDGALLASLPGAQVVPDLARPTNPLR